MPTTVRAPVSRTTFPMASPPKYRSAAAWLRITTGSHAVLRIRIGKESAFQQWDLNGFEVVGRDLVERDVRVPRQFAAWDLEVDGPEISTQG